MTLLAAAAQMVLITLRGRKEPFYDSIFFTCHESIDVIGRAGIKVLPSQIHTMPSCKNHQFQLFVTSFLEACQGKFGTLTQREEAAISNNRHTAVMLCTPTYNIKCTFWGKCVKFWPF